MTTSEIANSKNETLQRWTNYNSELSSLDINRYSRHLLIPSIGVSGQVKIKNSSVCIVGCGGLGSPAALYLAAAGFGCIGLVDYDSVEISNLQRQIIHAESRVGKAKTESASESIRALNSSVRIKCHTMALDTLNASVLSEYDIILDCSDNVATRYLLNDACMLFGKPLVSGSALMLHGQLTVYWKHKGPCYRCLFPTPPPRETVTNCSDGGVLGAVPGIIGVLQAVEAIKIALERPCDEIFTQKLLLYDAFGAALSPFKVVKLRRARDDCAVCSANANFSATAFSSTDYVRFCGSGPTDGPDTLDLLDDADHIECAELFSKMASGERFVLLDVRDEVQTKICGLQAVKIPLENLQSDANISLLTKLAGGRDANHLPIYIICRRGNDSQIAVQLLRKQGFKGVVLNLKGGLLKWSSEIDPKLAIY